MKTRISRPVTALVVITFWVVLPTIPPFSQQKAPGIFDGQSDVGKVMKSGSARYNAEEDEYTIEGSGANIWADRDDFHFVWKQLQRNFILTTRARLIGLGVEAHRKIGWM